MGTLTALLLTAPMFGLKLAWSIGARTASASSPGSVELFGVAPRLCAYFTPTIHPAMRPQNGR